MVIVIGFFFLLSFKLSNTLLYKSTVMCFWKKNWSFDNFIQLCTLKFTEIFFQCLIVGECNVQCLWIICWWYSCLLSTWSRVSCQVSMRVVFYFPFFLRHCPKVDPQGTSPFIGPYIYLYHSYSPSLDVFYKKLPFPFPYYFPMPVLLSPQSRSQYFTPSWMLLTWLTFMAALCFHILQKNAIKLPSTCWPPQ